MSSLQEEDTTPYNPIMYKLYYLQESLANIKAILYIILYMSIFEYNREINLS